MIELGQEARDKITGFKGVLTSRHQYITGCDQYDINPGLDDKKVPGEIYRFDEGRIEVIGRGINPKEVQTRTPGGPQDESKQIK